MSEHTPETAAEYFDAILPGRLGFGPSEFEEIPTFGDSYIIVRVDGTGNPTRVEVLERSLAQDEEHHPKLIPIFDHETGESVPLMGPITIQALKTRNRIRLVRVKFFHYFLSASKGYTAQVTHTAIGWQGDHAVHLLTPITEVPHRSKFAYVAEAVLSPIELDNEHVRRLDVEDIEDWYLDADLSV